MTPLPLAGVRVLDLSRVLAGPFSTMMLGDLGADVVKVELPGRGDDLRAWGPPFLASGESTYFLAVNRNKRSLALDLRVPADGERFRALLARADVLVENFRAGYLERLGYTDAAFEAINPHLVRCTIHAFSSPAMQGVPGYDLILQAMSGVMDVTGPVEGPPSKVGFAAVDVLTGLYAALAVAAALARPEPRRYLRLDLAMLDCAAASMVNWASGYLLAGARPERLGNAHPNVAPYDVFAAQDGHVAIACGNQSQWEALCRVLGRPEFLTRPEWATNAGRVRDRANLNAALGEVIAQEAADAWVERLNAGGIPCQRVSDLPSVIERGVLDPSAVVGPPPGQEASGLRWISNPIRLNDERLAVRTVVRAVGEHGREVLRDWLGEEGGTTGDGP